MNAEKPLIRKATKEDIPTLIIHLNAMLQAMEANGGHPLANEEDIENYLQARLNEKLEQNDMLYLIAEFNHRAVAVLEASHMQISGLFLRQEVLHIHGIYVNENYRRNGIARKLIEQAIAWGHQQACTIARLNVLVDNPARHLYYKLGFTEFEYEMIRPL